jgi:hypothetical protein
MSLWTQEMRCDRRDLVLPALKRGYTTQIRDTGLVIDLFFFYSLSLILQNKSSSLFVSTVQNSTSVLPESCDSQICAFLPETPSNKMKNSFMQQQKIKEKCANSM